MILCDANVWLALANSAHIHHPAARRWFDGVSEPHSVLFCRATQQALLRLLTNPSVLAPYGGRPLGNRAAWRIYEAFRADDRVGFRLDEPRNQESRWMQLALCDTASTKLWMDAYLAAFAIGGGLQFVTTDVAFRQFAELDHVILSRTQEAQFNR